MLTQGPFAICCTRVLLADFGTTPGPIFQGTRGMDLYQALCFILAYRFAFDMVDLERGECITPIAREGYNQNQRVHENLRVCRS